MRARGSRPAAKPPSSALDVAVFWLAAALALVVPLVWDSDCLEPFRGPKRELALVIWIALAAAFLARGARSSVWRDAWWLAWAGVLAGGVISAATTEHPGVALMRLAPVALAALGWGAVRQLDERRRRRLVTLVVAAGVTQAILTGLLTLPAFRPAAFANIPTLAGRFMWIGTLGNPADVGVFLVLPIMLAAAAALTGDPRGSPAPRGEGAEVASAPRGGRETSPSRKERRSRRLHIAALAVMLAAAVATRTLTAAIALTGGFAVLLWRLVPRRWRTAAVAGVALLAVAAALVGPFARRVTAAVSEFRRGGWWSIGSGRGAGFGAALAMAGARPLTGVGFGQFESNYYRFQPEEVLARRAQTLGRETAFGTAHNDPLQFAAETGAVGLLLAGAGLVIAVRRGGTAGGVLPVRGPLLVAAAPLLLLQFPLHLAASAGQMALLAALALPSLPVAPPATDRRRTVACWLAAVAATALATYAAWQRYRTSIAWQQASTLVTAIQQGQIATGRAEAARAALANLEPRLRWYPGAWDARIVTGNVAMLANRPEVALRHFQTALALAERPECRFNVGMALLALGDREAGYAHLLRAIKLNPLLYHQISNREAAADVRRRLDADGYGQRYPWIYRPSRSAR